MERSLLWGAIAVGVVGWLQSLLAAGSLSASPHNASTPFPRPHLLLAAALPVLVFLLTLPEAPPFARGQGFGHGFLLGALGALGAAFVAGRTLQSHALHNRDEENRNSLAPLLAAQFLAVAIVALALWLLRAQIMDALCGIALGWLCVSLVLHHGFCDVKTSDASLASGTIFAVTLCGASALGVHRDFLSPEIPRGTWSALCVAFATGIPFSVLLSSFLPRSIPSRIARVLGAGVVAILLLLLANLLALKVIAQPRVAFVVGVGILAGILLWWSSLEETGDESTPALPLGAFAMLAAVVMSFGLLQGFGIGLMLLAASPFLNLSLGHADDARSAHAIARNAQLLAFGAILLLQRWFEQKYRAELRGVAITDYYALLGFLSGALLPAFLSCVMSRRASTPIMRLVLAGALAIVAPAILLIIWGAKISFALFFGLALSFLLASHKPSTRVLISSLCALAIALALIEWTRHLLPISEMARADRIRALSYCIGAILVLVIASDWSARRARGVLR